MDMMLLRVGDRPGLKNYYRGYGIKIREISMPERDAAVKYATTLYGEEKNAEVLASHKRRHCCMKAVVARTKEPMPLTKKVGDEEFPVTAADLVALPADAWVPLSFSDLCDPASPKTWAIMFPPKEDELLLSWFMKTHEAFAVELDEIMGKSIPVTTTG